MLTYITIGIFAWCIIALGVGLYIGSVLEVVSRQYPSYDGYTPVYDWEDEQHLDELLGERF